MSKMIILMFIFIVSLFNSNVIAGGVYAPEQNIISNRSIEINQTSNIYIEVGKWVGGVVTASFAVWFAWYLKNKKKKSNG